MVMNLKSHRIASIFPPLEAKEIASLAEDIKANGLHHPIALFEGKILDGRNRYAACLKAGVKPMMVQWKGTVAEAIAFVWSENFQRRHLTASQAAACYVEREKTEKALIKTVKAIKEDAKARQRTGGKTGGATAGRGRPKTDRVQERIPEAKRKAQPQSRDEVAKIAGANPRYVEQARTIQQKAPEKLKAVAAGKKTIPQAMREIRKEEVKEKVKLPSKSKKYRVVYADPPWSYGNAGIIGDDNYGHVGRHYQSMTITELCAMDVKSLVEKDAVLFLWVTSPLLSECWPVITAWGFKYKTSFVWNKVKHNFGHYNSVRHEFLLVCTRGSCTPDTRKLYPSVVTVERSKKHSEKPEQFRKMIDTLYPHGNRIELFARKRAHGWDAHGDEIGAAIAPVEIPMPEQYDPDDEVALDIASRLHDVIMRDIVRNPNPWWKEVVSKSVEAQA